MAPLYTCCVPTGNTGEYDCNRVLTRKKGDPKQAPIIPEEAPETILIATLDLSGVPNVIFANLERIGS
jgi:hypothetical protein